MTIWDYIDGASKLHATNGIAASKSAAFLAVTLFVATAICVWRLFTTGHAWDARRRENLFWVGVCMAGACVNRFTVVLFYRQIIDATSWQPTIGAVIWIIGTIGFARSATVDFCGNKGWLGVTFLGLLGFFFFG